MAAGPSPMTCPSCGVAMNRHAEKLVYPTGAADRTAVDPVLGGIVQERHACPECGGGATRRGTSGAAATRR